MVGPRFRLTLLTTWRILLKTNAVSLKLKNRQRRPLTLKERNRGLNRVLLITNLIMLLFLMFLTLASALTTLLSPFDCSPFSLDKPHFCPDLSSGEEPASLVDWKDTGETTAPISFLQEDHISQPSDVFDFEKSSDSCLFKVGSLREHVDFWSNSIRASDFIINTIVEGNRCVKWHTDNQNVACIIGVGSRMSSLQSEAKRILRFAFIMAFLLSLNGYPDPVMTKQII